MAETTTSKEQAKAAANTAKKKGKQEAESVKAVAQDKAADVGSEAKSHAKGLVGEARQATKQRAESQGEQFSSMAKNLADEMKTMANSADGRLSGLVGENAERIERFARKFDDGGIDALASDAKRFARKRPVVFLATTFVAGFAAGRMLRHADTDELKEAVQSGASDSPDSPLTGSPVAGGL